MSKMPSGKEKVFGPLSLTRSPGRSCGTYGSNQWPVISSRKRAGGISGGCIVSMWPVSLSQGLIILTSGFAKKTQKTPEREIALAEQRERDHLNQRKQR